MCFPAISEGSSRTIHLKDFNFESDSDACAINNYSSEYENFGACVGGDITIEVIGNCSINMSTAGSTAIKLAKQNITFKGSGTLTVKGGKGADATVADANGTDGGVGIICKNLTVDMTHTYSSLLIKKWNCGKLLACGGDGGNGANGISGNHGGKGADGYAYHDDGEVGGRGTDGTNGGNGGTGGSAIVAEKVIDIGSEESHISRMLIPVKVAMAVTVVTAATATTIPILLLT